VDIYTTDDAEQFLSDFEAYVIFTKRDLKNKEDIVVIKRVNEALVVTEGNMKNIKGEHCALNAGS
jgi:hypothetical protein